MKRAHRILIGAGCLALLLISWVVAISAKSDDERQVELIMRASVLIDDEIYISAVPLLEEAAGYNGKFTPAAEAELKKAYLALIDKKGFRRKYTDLLDKQMSRQDANPVVFAEAADYYLGISRLPEALSALKTGIERTGSPELIGLYEDNRYAYGTNRTSYDYVASICGNAAQVMMNGSWGLARYDGVLMIPCEYEKISTYSGDRAIVMKNNEIYAVDSGNNRVAKLHEYAADFGNFSDDRIPLLVDGGWIRATGKLIPGTVVFEQLGMYSGGYAAAKTGGKWGVIDSGSNWLIPAQCDWIIRDELGRSYARGAVFARKDGAVRLYTGGQWTGETYEDARPFSEDGYAAARKDGKWGFIDISGTNVIDFIFDDALSFGQHLAAVKLNGLWGYINKYGNIVIEPVFSEAKSFSNGCAPVLTERGWQFIMLLEYESAKSF